MNGIIIDCFAGGCGASVGIEMALGRPVDIAINHDPQAIRMHQTNHPQTLHLTEDIFKVDLEKYFAGRNTITTSPGHFGLISAFLIKYYGTGCGQELKQPLGTITTKDRFGLVNVIADINGEKYILKDIFLQMLKLEELKVMQGFPKDYVIDRDYNWQKYPVCEQVKRIGNSVVPIMAETLVSANCPYLKIGERQPAPMIYMQQNGQIAFA